MEPTKAEILAGYSRASHDLDAWLKNAGDADLRRRSNGTRWTNEELLFHMVFGYMVVRALLPLVHLISRLPEPAGKAFAAVLNAGTRPFDVVNYWGSRAAALVYNKRRMRRKLDKTMSAISRSLERESSRSLARSMPFPDRWDPFFTPAMTLGDVYAYPTLHFDFHARQLSLSHPPMSHQEPHSDKPPGHPVT
ncbi:DinB family protein (plasmid) [Arthrobacter sp. FW305-BF8]|uniref:DinB family protein n=1 Tax=Arthrobacter sp. FW305-BF8 TaxID=2879617 RepID=UPI001F307C38|nr:DinB family protein [Arthrobacter sp. FW305-BF8]UKA56643.1 DinB family protein [Arthrobacter sp. FW305-BF8]